MVYKIKITADAKQDLDYFKTYDKKVIVTAIKKQLTYEPSVETKNRKKLRENPLATWELRSGRFRIFYEVVEDTVQVIVISVGIKDHNVLYIRGREVII